MQGNSTSDIHLSKGILEMKFMKKSKDKALKRLEAEESREMYSNDITEEMKKAGNVIFVDTSITTCKNLIEGRLSFGGMNPDIERIIENEFAQRLDQIEKKKEKDISDQDMAKRYSSVAETMQKKFQKQKKKFKKPSSDI